MKIIISGTNRPGSRTLAVCKIIQELYREAGELVEILDLGEIDLPSLNGTQYGSTPAGAIGEAIAKINQAEGLIVVVPEYNGSMPGALKYFIDHWSYPESFEFRPVAFVGLGGQFGGLRPVEHLQQVFGYRNAFVFPVRVFIFNVWNQLKDGKLQDSKILDLLKVQCQEFIQFVSALKSHQLDALSRKKNLKK